MEKLPFVIWMVGWPLATALISYLYVKRSSKDLSEIGWVIISLTYTAVWIFIGLKLWYAS